MALPRWAAPLDFRGLDLGLTEFDVMADLDPNWIGWAAEVIAEAAVAADHEVAA